MWITGLPASGKSTVAAALIEKLRARGIEAAILESDALRKVFSRHPSYSEEERDSFYRLMAYIGALLIAHGVPVIFDATANRRIYRERARREIPRFLEVFVDCPLAVCMARDPKRIYQKAGLGIATSVPGLQAVYEPPEEPDVTVHGDREAPEAAAERVIARLEERGYVLAGPKRREAKTKSGSPL